MDNDQRGRRGQSVFQMWCSSCQPEMVSVEAVPDRFGWDYHVTLSHAAPPVRSNYEGAPVERDCKVQVKTAITGERSVRISLSNWHRMVKDLKPWFVVIFTFPENADEPLEAFAVHVGEARVAKVYERLRKEDVASHRSAELNKLEMLLSFTDADRVADPAILRAHIERHLGISEKAYVDEKERWKREVGYDKLPIKGAFTIEAADEDELHKMWADLAVGLRPNLPLKKFHAHEIRFGISKPLVELAEGGSLALTNAPTAGEVVVTFRSVDESQFASLSCSKRISTTVAPWLPPEYRKVRLTAPMADFVIDSFRDGTADLEISFSLPLGTESTPLTDIGRVSRLIELLADARGDLVTIKLAIAGTDKTEQVQAPAPPMAENLVREARAFSGAERLASYASLDVARLTVRPAEIVAQKLALYLVGNALDPAGDKLELEMRTPPDEIPASLSGKKAAYYRQFAIPLGDEVVSGVVTGDGNAILVPAGDGKYEISLKPDRRRILGLAVTPRNEWSLETFIARTEAVVKELEGNGVEILIGSSGPPTRALEA